MKRTIIRDVYLGRTMDEPIAETEQYDSLVFKLRLIDDGVIINPSSQSFELWAKRPSDTVVQQITNITSDSEYVTIDVLDSFVVEYGIVNFQLKIQDSTGKVQTSKFKIKINQSIYSATPQQAQDEIQVLDNISGVVSNLQTQINTKMDKGGQITVSQINKNAGKIDETYLSDTLLEQIAGTTPISSTIADGSITTEKIADNAIDNTKILTSLQPVEFLHGKDNELPNFDSVNKIFTIPQGGYDNIIYIGNTAYNGIRNISVSLDVGGTSAGKLVFNKSTKTISAYAWNSTIDETAEVLIAFFRYADSKYVVNMKGRYTVDGKTPIADNSITYTKLDTSVTDVIDNVNNNISLLENDILDLQSLTDETINVIKKVNGTSIDINDTDLWEIGSVSNDTTNWATAKSQNTATDRLRMKEVMFIESGTYNIECYTYRSITYKLYANLTDKPIDCPTWFVDKATIVVPQGGAYIGFLIQASTLDVITNGDVIINITPQLEKAKEDIVELQQKVSNPHNEVIMVAHRGLSYFYPENTMVSFYKACEYGFKYIETDIFVTSDGYFVIMHDSTVDRTTDGTGAVSSLTLSQIKTLTIDAGNGIENYPNLKVPTLREFLQLCKEQGVTPVLELKASLTKAKAYDLIELLREYQFETQAVCIGENTTNLEYVKEISPAIPVQPLLTISKENIDYCASLGKNVTINTSYNTSDMKTLVKYAHSKNIKVNCWTVNNVYDYQDLMSYGIDFISTDYLMHNQQLLSIREMYKVNNGTSATTINIASPNLGVDVYECSVEVLYKSGNRPYIKSWGYQMDYPEDASGWVQLKMQIWARTSTVYIQTDTDAEGNQGQFEFRNFKVIHHKM